MSDGPMPAWERRFRAPSVLLPAWAPAAPDACVVATNESGSWQLYAWDRRAGTRRRLTDDPIGIQAVAQGEREGFAIYVSSDGGPALEIHRHAELVSIGGHRLGGFNRGGLSADGSLLCYEHAEGGNLLRPDLRVVDPRTGGTVAELSDGQDRGITAWGWSPIPGDQRLAIRHELEGRERPGVWSPLSGERANLEVDLPGSVEDVWDWWPDGSALLVSLTHEARDQLLRIDVGSGEVSRVEHPPGTVSGAAIRDDGEVWY
jgi:hypothetical protein